LRVGAGARRLEVRRVGKEEIAVPDVSSGERDSGLTNAASGADEQDVAARQDEADQRAGAQVAPEPGAAARFVATIRDALRRWYLNVTLLVAVILVVATVLGQSVLVVVGLGLALLAEWAACYPPAWDATRLGRLGLGTRSRVMLRGLAVAVTLAIDTSGRASILLAYAATFVVGQLAWVSFNRSMTRAIALRPMLGVANIGQDLGLRTFYARARRRRALGPIIIVTMEAVAVLGIVVALVTPLPDPLAVVAAAVSIAGMIAFAGFAQRWSERFLSSGRAERYEEQLVAQLREFDPQGIVYVAAAAGQPYMFSQWLRAYNACRQRLMFVVAEASYLETVGDTHWPIVYAPRTRDVERCVLPNVRLGFYMSNSGKNITLLREPGIKHVFLNHGDSDKSTSANPVARVYDELWVAGPTAIERYEAAGIDIAPERFAVIGRPQVDGVIVGPRERGPTVGVLYAPTWEGYYEESNYSSLEVMGAEMVRRLLADHPECRIIFKPHPGSGRQRPSMIAARREIEDLLRGASKAQGHVVADDHPELSVYDWFDAADICISDISSVVSDFLFTGRPVIVSNPKNLPHDEYLELFPSQQASYLLDCGCTGLSSLLQLALGDDPMAAARRAMKIELLGDLPAGPLHAFCANADRLYEQACRDASRVRNTFSFADSAAVESFKLSR